MCIKQTSDYYHVETYLLQRFTQMAFFEGRLQTTGREQLQAVRDYIYISDTHALHSPFAYTYTYSSYRFCNNHIFCVRCRIRIKLLPRT